MKPLRIAVTADLHWGHHQDGMTTTRNLFAHLLDHPPDVLILAGDIGTGTLFADCLTQLDALSCIKAIVPGNHDVWVKFESEFDSLQLYEQDLPRIAREHGFHYLDQGPLVLPESDLALVGTMNWYDHSWALEKLHELYPDEVQRLTTKRFTRGKHNDANFVRWLFDDVGFTRKVVDVFAGQLESALSQASRAIVVTHHPPFYDLGFPRLDPPSALDSLLWDAFTGNRSMEEHLERWADRIPFAFCGHTHRARRGDLRSIRGWNIGGDYHFKRLLLLDWPTGSVAEMDFTA